MSYFTICGSRVMTLKKSYKLAINGYGEKKQQLKLSMNVGDKKIEAKEIEIGGNESQIVEFDMREHPIENYILNVEKVGEDEGVEKFEKSINLNMNTTMAVVVIQTDKGVYKPSDNVQYRVIAFDAETKPYVGSNSEILIIDGAQNILKKITNPKWSNGIFQDQMQLSDQPITGKWEIRVKIDESIKKSKTFDVDEYVLPKLEVVIDTEPDIYLKNEKLVADISAKYTYGKYAKGKAIVTVAPQPRYHCFGFRHPGQNIGLENITKTVDIDEDKATIEFDIKDLDSKLNLSSSYIPELNLKVEFIEDLTQTKYHGSTKIKCHSEENSIEFVVDDSQFYPGMPFTITAKILRYDKKLITTNENEKSTFIINVSRSWEEKLTKNGKSLKINHNTDEEFEELIEIKDGIVQYVIDPVEENTENIRVNIKYKNCEQSYYFYKAPSASDQYLKSFYKQNGNEMEVKVYTTENIQNLTYHVLSMNDVIESKNINFELTKQTSFKIAIPEKYRLAELKIFIFYVRTTGEIVFDKKSIQSTGSLNNTISLNMQADVAKPGQEFELNVASKEKSVIGMLAVDKSVLLMKHDNDFTKSVIMNQLKNFAVVNKYNDDYTHQRGHTYTIFDDLETFIITNAITEKFRETPMRCMKMLAHSSLEMAEMQMADAVEAPRMMAFGAAPQAVGGLFGAASSGFGNAPPPPPMAMMRSAKKAVEIKIRKDFPETWFFDLVDAADGNAKISKKVPDTITSWVLSGFSMSSIYGLGMLDQSKELKVFQPFFVSANLPYSVKREEIVSIQFLVFNYLENNQNVELTFFNENDEFEFQETHEGNSVTKVVDVKANDAMSVKFVVKPKKVGRMKIKVKAVSDVAGDMIEQFLLVKPEGICHYKNDAFIVNLKERNEFKRSLKIETPEKIVPGSKRVEISLIGDIMGPTLDNLDKLIRIPYGCGEQNMLNFVPNIIVLDYLNSMKKMTPTIFTKAKKFMEKGYQSELTYKHHDGSYSAFGMSDQSGCTWLTAFVAKSFYQAKRYIEVDENVIEQALDFLVKVQNSDGSFSEVGSLFHKEMQGGASAGIALTSYVLITFLENEKSREKYKKVIDNALKFIGDRIDSIKDNYSMTVTAYALQVANHPLKDKLMEKLEESSCNEDGMKYWTIDRKEQELKKPRSINIEMTAYALQAYILAGRDVDSFFIMKWLISQRNSRGGFHSTQDTIVGLAALSKSAANNTDSNKNIEVLVKYQDKESKFKINEENSMVLQSHVLSSDTQELDVQATGQGICIMQMSHQYHVSDAEKKIFQLNANVLKQENLKLVIKIDVSFQSEKKSNMVVLEVELPSGFVFNKEHEEDLKKNQLVKRVETREGETSVAVYFDEMNSNSNTLEFHAEKSHEVANLKPANVKVYDYYDNEHTTSTFYQVKN